MAENTARKQRWVVFSSNIDLQMTLKKLEESELVETVVPTGTRGREGEGKSPEGGNLRVIMRGWDPPAFMISPRGRVQCWYYEDMHDVNEVLRSLPEGSAYAYPEYTAVVAIRRVLVLLLVPAKGEELELRLVNSSIPRDYFESLSSQRFEKLSSRISNVCHICSCGKAYVSETWYKKHIQKCTRYDPARALLQFSGVLARPGTTTVVGESPFGIVKLEETRSWQELKAAAGRTGKMPIVLGHPKKPRW